jgi:hypothetical protein
MYLARAKCPTIFILNRKMAKCKPNFYKTGESRDKNFDYGKKIWSFFPVRVIID